jgi:hypothetical protein
LYYKLRLNVIFLFLSINLSIGCKLSSIPGYLSGYKKLSDTEKSRIKFITENDIGIKKSTDTIYATNAALLLKNINSDKRAIVYTWSPHCHSSTCYSLSAVKAYAEKNNAKLYIVMDYYDFEMLSIQKSDNIYSINHFYYKTDKNSKYGKRFEKELMQTEAMQKKYRKNYLRYLLFENGNFIQPIEDILAYQFR